MRHLTARHALAVAVAVVVAAAAPVAMATTEGVWRAVDVAPPLLVPQGELAGVSCAALGACEAVGSTVDAGGHRVALAEGLTSSGWAVQAVPSPAGAVSTRLLAVSCPVVATCVTVGTTTDASAKDHPLAEVWAGGAWHPSALPDVDLGALVAVSCVTTTSCVAVGSAPAAGGPVASAYRFDGTVWAGQTLAAPSAGELRGVSCRVDGCLAVGRVGDAPPAGTLAERFDGTAWTSLPAPAAADELEAVACPTTATDCIAVGSGDAGPVALHWDGARWTDLPVTGASATTLVAVSCAAANACTATGESGFSTELERYDGTGWSPQASAFDDDVFDLDRGGVSCPTTQFCVAVGASSVDDVARPRAQEWHGGVWSLDDVPAPAGAVDASLASVACASPANCLALGHAGSGEGGQAFAERLDGGTWHRLAVPLPGGATDASLQASCPTPQVCFAVGTATVEFTPTAVAERLDGTTWTTLAIGMPAGADAVNLAGLSCPAADRCEAVGTASTFDGQAWPVAATYDGRWRWDAIAPPGSSAITVTGVSCPDATHCWAVGANDGSPVAAHLDGGTWSVVPVPAPPDGAAGSELDGVSCVAATSCVAVGQFWRTPQPHPGLAFAARLDGSTWSLAVPASPSASQSPLASVSCATTHDCVAVGSWVDGAQVFHPQIQRFDGTAWHLQQPVERPGAAAGLLGVSCPSPTACVAVGAYGFAASVADIQVYASR